MSKNTFAYGMLTLLANDCMYVKYLKIVANSVTGEFNGGKYVVTVCFILLMQLLA